MSADYLDDPKESSIETRPGRLIPLSAVVLSSIFLLFDVIAFVAAGAISFAWLVDYPGAPIDLYVFAVCFITLLATMLFNFAGLYRFERAMSPLQNLDAIAVAFVAAFLFLFAAAFSVQISASFSRVWIGAFGAGSFVGVIGLRYLVVKAIWRLADMSMLSRRVAIFGAGEQCRHLLAALRGRRLPFLAVSGIFAETSDSRPSEIDGYPVLGGIEELLASVRQNDIDDVIVALPWTEDARILSAASKLRELPVNLYLSSDLIGFRMSFRAPPGHMSELPVYEIAGTPLSGWDVVLKAIEDYVLATVLLIVLSPVMLAIAIAIKLDSPGDVLFRQKRLGFNNRTFEIYKFRTMRRDAGLADKTVQATRDDPRITRTGKFLRRTSLDELPQLFNVLNGTMSLVGPRPHAVDHNAEYAQKIRGYFARHRMKPGITGLAQVKGLRGETDTLDKMDSRVKSDVAYTDGWSVMLDLQILAKTIVVCLSGRNAH